MLGGIHECIAYRYVMYIYVMESENISIGPILQNLCKYEIVSLSYYLHFMPSSVWFNELETILILIILALAKSALNRS